MILYVHEENYFLQDVTGSPEGQTFLLHPGALFAFIEFQHESRDSVGRLGINA